MKPKIAAELKDQLPAGDAVVPFDGFIVLNDGESYSRMDGCAYIGRTGQIYDLKELVPHGLMSMQGDTAQLMSTVVGDLNSLRS